MLRKRDEKARVVAEKERRIESLGPEPELLRYEPAMLAMIGLRPWLNEATDGKRKLHEEIRRNTETARKLRKRIATGMDRQSPGRARLDAEVANAAGQGGPELSDAMFRRARVRKLY